jgi:HSP20 family protein
VARTETEEGKMKDIILRDLFDDLVGFRRDFNDMFNKFVTRGPWLETSVPANFTFMPAVEAYVDKNTKKYFCKVYLPGIEPKEVQINVLGNLLTITGERKYVETKKEVDLFEKEVTYGKFERTITLPEGVLADKFVAEFTNGVLELTAPVTMQALPRKIEITTPMVKKIAA